MLRINELKAFAKQCVDDINNLLDYHLVGSEDELSKRIRDIAHLDDTCSLVVILPTYNGSFGDEDNRKMRNNLLFMVIKKTDSGGGTAERIQVFTITQEIIIQLIKKIAALHYNNSLNCVFKDIDLNSIQVDPVQDYFETNGYGLEFSTKTPI